MTESVQWTLLVPLVLLLVLGILQVGLLAHGRNVALQAATVGAELSALADGTAGSEAARSLAERGGLSGIEVDLESSGDQVRVRVAGTMPSFVDLGLTRVSVQVTRFRERVTSTP